jgi:hypothetical protein
LRRQAENFSMHRPKRRPTQRRRKPEKRRLFLKKLTEKRSLIVFGQELEYVVSYLVLTEHRYYEIFECGPEKISNRGERTPKTADNGV